MEINQWVECPYCGTKNAVYNEVNSTNYTVRKVVTCDIEAGGCERMFVVGYRLTVEATTLKIEGEAEKHDPVDAAEAETQAWAADGEIATAESWENDPIRY